MCSKIVFEDKRQRCVVRQLTYDLLRIKYLISSFFESLKEQNYLISFFFESLKERNSSLHGLQNIAIANFVPL